MDKTLDILRRTFLFVGVEDALDSAVLPAHVSFKKGDVIYGETDFRRALGILLSGKAKATPLSNDSTVLNVFAPGAVFGAAAVFSDGGEYVSRITAESDCKVLFLDEAALSALFADVSTDGGERNVHLRHIGGVKAMRHQIGSDKVGGRRIFDAFAVFSHTGFSFPRIALVKNCLLLQHKYTTNRSLLQELFRKILRAAGRFLPDFLAGHRLGR